MLTLAKPPTVFRLFCLISCYMAVCRPPEACGAPPATPSRPVVDTYHGITVSESYRWLEDGRAPAVSSWTKSQNEHARSYLDALPQAESIREQVRRILTAKTIRYRSLAGAGDRFFVERFTPPQQQPVIVVLPADLDSAKARVIFDPNQLDATGKSSIDWYRASPDGALLAVSVSKDGSELGDLMIVDVESGRVIDDRIAAVNSGTAGGSLAWSRDGSGFYYTKHFPVQPDRSHAVYQQVYFHRLGTPVDQDRYELGKGFLVIAEIQLTADSRSDHLLATVQQGDGGQFAHFLRSADGEWRQFSTFGDKMVQAVFGRHDDLYVVSFHDAPRGKILRLKLDELNLEGAKLILDESESAIVSGGTAFWGERTVVPTDDRLYVVYQLGGPSNIRAFDLDGKPAAAPTQSEVATVQNLLPIAANDLLFAHESFIQPTQYLRFEAATHQTTGTPLSSDPVVNFDDALVLRRTARSLDGTRVPLSIIMKRDSRRNGQHPCLVTGYGGYNVSVEPSYRPINRVLLDHGMIFVVTNLRGGGEFGEQWHQEGCLTNKQNVFDDFHACLCYLIAQDFTCPERLAITGGSNGGLLMGATLTQHPELIRAVVSFVGIYDMLRVELSPNGSFNVTEFGTVKDKQQFQALYGYSPYHRIVDGVRYPATLLLTGENDPRVDPMQSRKMAARLQAATQEGRPILLRTSADAGHGVGSSLDELVEQTVDQLSFLFAELNVPVPAKATAR